MVYGESNGFVIEGLYSGGWQVTAHWRTLSEFDRPGFVIFGVVFMSGTLNAVDSVTEKSTTVLCGINLCHNVLTLEYR